MAEIKPVTPEARALADRVIKALATDELVEGYDLAAGMFGTRFSQILIELAGYKAWYEEAVAESNLAGYGMLSVAQVIRHQAEEIRDLNWRLDEARQEASAAKSELNWSKDRTQWGA